jgi:hypothetical protein
MPGRARKQKPSCRRRHRRHCASSASWPTKLFMLAGARALAMLLFAHAGLFQDRGET